MKRVTRSVSSGTDFLELSQIPPKRKKMSKKSQLEKTNSNVEECDNSLTNIPTVDENSNKVDHQFNYDMLESIENIKEILGTKYLNIVDRLKLDWVPGCLRTFNNCGDHQKELNADYYQLNVAKTLFFSSNHQHFKGLLLFEDMITNKIFPYPEIFQDLIHYILTIRKPGENAIEGVQLLFCNLLNIFPPCQIRDDYSNFVTESINVPKYIPYKRSSNTTILEFIITQIECALSDCQLYEKEKTSGELRNDAMNSSELLNFSEWEMKQETENFDLHNRTQRLERLFAALDLIVRLFESDTAVFMMKFQKNVLFHLFNEDTQPIVVKAFKMNQYKMSSILVKSTLKIFSDLVAFDYPDYCKDIFSRIISIISSVINLSENDMESEGLVEFPCIGSRTSDFAKEIFKACDYNNIQLYFDSLKYLKIPYIKFLFVDQVITKVYQKQIKLHSPDDILRTVLSNDPLWFQLNTKPESQNLLSNNNEEPCLFPLITKLKVHKSVEFFREDFMELALISMKCFCDTYDVKRCCFLFSVSRRDIVLKEIENEPKVDFINVASDAFFAYGREYLKAYAILYNKIDYLERKCQVDLKNWKEFLFDNL
ncbi:hypothetical protein ACFFRR_009924 [Megaselia abdita]